MIAQITHAQSLEHLTHMPKPNRLTNNSDETDIATLISGDTVFAIPYFQRAYKWKRMKTELRKDDF